MIVLRNMYVKEYIKYITEYIKFNEMYQIHISRVYQIYKMNVSNILTNSSHRKGLKYIVNI